MCVVGLDQGQEEDGDVMKKDEDVMKKDEDVMKKDEGQVVVVVYDQILEGWRREWRVQDWRRRRRRVGEKRRREIRGVGGRDGAFILLRARGRESPHFLSGALFAVSCWIQQAR
jgi:hypothetical protein